MSVCSVWVRYRGYTVNVLGSGFHRVLLFFSSLFCKRVYCEHLFLPRLMLVETVKKDKAGLSVPKL